MKFVVNGAKASSENTPKLVLEAIAVLEKLPDGELLTTRALASRLRRAYSTVNGFGVEPTLEKFHMRVSRGNVVPNNSVIWGNTKTIAEAREEF